MESDKQTSENNGTERNLNVTNKTLLDYGVRFILVIVQPSPFCLFLIHPFYLKPFDSETVVLLHPGYSRGCSIKITKEKKKIFENRSNSVLSIYINGITKISSL